MKVAIIGGGSIGSRHATNARTLGHEVTVFDIDARRGANMDSFIADAVLICTPADTHEEVAAQLLAGGYYGPLFVEKPVAVRSDPLVFSEWPHPTTMVGYNWRFHPDLALLAELVRGGTLGMLCYTDMRAWPGRYGEPLLECSHEIDLACAWLGAPTSIHGQIDGEPSAWVQMDHPRGFSNIEIRWFHDGEPMRRLSFALPGGTVITARPDVSANATALQNSYRDELRHFLEAAERSKPTACSFADGLRVVQICERVKELAFS